MGTAGVTVAAVVVAVVGIVAVVVALRRRPGPLGGSSLARIALAVGAAGFAVTAVVAVASRPRPAFPVVHLWYLAGTIALPATGLALVVAVAVRRGRWAVGALGGALLLLAPVGWYASHVAPYRLAVDRSEVALPAARAGDDPIRVGVLADLQTTEITSYEERAVDELLAERPDVILVAGDLFQGGDDRFVAEAPAFRALLGRLEAPGGVYAVRGDVDTGDRMDVLLEGTGIEILDNEIAELAVGDRSVRIGGNPLRWAPPEGVAVRDDLAASDPADVRILLAHRPEVVLGLKPTDDIDLVVAGHTHGGQVAVPGFGPLLTFTEVPRSVAAGGLHDVDGHAIYVSTGVGMVREQAPQIRLFTRPTIGLITLA